MKRVYSEYLVKAGIIGAIYAVLTVVLAPISYGVLQIRLSEILCILPIYTPCAIPGLALGCFISGLFGPYGIADAAFGCIASLIGAFGTYKLRKHKYIAAFTSVLSNSVIVGFSLHTFYLPQLGLFECMIWIFAGEFVSVMILGNLVLKYLSTKGDDFLKDHK